MKLFSQTRLHVSINKIPFSAACISKNKPVKQKILMLRETERTARAACLKSLPKDGYMHLLTHCSAYLITAVNTPAAGCNSGTFIAQTKCITFPPLLSNCFWEDILALRWWSPVRGARGKLLQCCFSCVAGELKAHKQKTHLNPNTSRNTHHQCIVFHEIKYFISSL